jgi:hypothetical protein
MACLRRELDKRTSVLHILTEARSTDAAPSHSASLW